MYTHIHIIIYIYTHGYGRSVGTVCAQSRTLRLARRFEDIASKTDHSLTSNNVVGIKHECYVRC